MAFRAPGQHRPDRPASRPSAIARLPRRLLPVLALAVGLIIVICVAAGLWTDLLWFHSVGHAQTFGVTLGTKWALFLIVGLFMVIAVGFSAWLAWRLRPAEPAVPRQAAPEAYRLLIDPRRRQVLAAVLAVIGLLTGLSAAASWRTWLLFANRVPFGRTDPQFHLDISFFTFDYPFLRLVLTYLFTAVLLSLVMACAVHYLYGGLTPQRRGARATDGARTQLFLLAGLFVLLKAAAYWTDRYAIDFSQRGVVRTGASYTDVNAILPAKTVLAVIAVICGALFLLGALRRRPTLPAIGFGLLVLSAVLLGGVYPAIIQQFVVKPNELAKESPFLSREIAATRQAWGISGAATRQYAAASSQPASQLAAEAGALPDLRLADPGVLPGAFQQLQQVKSYYQFAPVLDMDRYAAPGTAAALQDTVIGVRELSGPPAGQGSWVNTHLVYTHGYGVVAAQADAATPDGNPVFTESNIPPGGQLGRFQPRVYFGEGETSYVIAGGRGQQEFDFPDNAAGGQHDSTYHGGGGVPLGSALDRVLYAIKYRQLNILLSGAINGGSRILYVRDPLARVAKVAPFLTLDRDAYPVVAGGQVDWVVDGYTTSDSYPYSERLPLQQATADSYQPGGALAGGGGSANYVRNSVKAVVNAYTGQVTLYQWGGRDPVLAAWKKAFPGLVRPASEIPAALRAHLRYPQAMFSLQRQVLTQFHVQNAAAFYAGQDFWQVPADPATGPPGRQNQPPYYLTYAPPGQTSGQFSLVTSLTQRGRPNLAAFVSVNSDPLSPRYGQLRVLQVPQEGGILGPQQVNNQFQSDPAASIELTQLRRGGSQVTFGNLVTLPLGGGLLSVQPVYVSADAAGAAGAYPALKRVFSFYNNQVGYAPTLAASLAQVFGTAAPQQPASPAQGGTALAKLLQQAQADYAQALAALRQDPPDYAAYGADLARMNAALGQAAKLAGQPPAPPGQPPGQRPSQAGSPSPSPSP